NPASFPLNPQKKIAYIAIGSAGESIIANTLKKELGATIFYFASKAKLGRQLMDDKATSSFSDATDSAGAANFISYIQNN
ncbi:hypothetical protein ABTK20_22615, partial [Acinetobacter baumannii]